MVEMSTTLPTVSVGLESKQPAKTTDPRPAARSTDTGKDDPGEAAYQILFTDIYGYTAVTVLPIAEQAARGTLASAVEARLNVPSIVLS
jgi:hypothetical protein